ncbi:hypothetical protein LLG95_05300 [bacterium]|nr:hypothetical protein [bacterium]
MNSLCRMMQVAGVILGIGCGFAFAQSSAMKMKGNIVSVGEVQASSVSTTGTVSAGNVTASGSVSGGSITTDGNVSAGSLNAGSANAAAVRIPNGGLGAEMPFGTTEVGQITYGLMATDGSFYPNTLGLTFQALHDNELKFVNDGHSGFKGIKIDKNGSVGIGDMAIFGNQDPGVQDHSLLYSSFQIYNVEPITFFNAGNGKRMLFNATYTYDPSTSICTPQYISNYHDYPVNWENPEVLNDPRDAPAASFYIDGNAKAVMLEVAPAGAAGDAVPFQAALNVSTETNSFTSIGNVGIKLPPGYRPFNALDVCGRIMFRDPATSYTMRGGLYADANGVHGQDANGNHTQLSSHFNPSDIDPQAVTSFADGDVALPFSFHHENEYIGKGEVIDMAKAMRYLERKMKAELGEKEGRLIYDYDLKPEKTKTLDDRRVDLVLSELGSMPMIKVPIPDNGHLPAEAVEMVDDFKVIRETKKIKTRELDLASGKVIPIENEVVTQTKVKTGKKVKKLKDGWIFKDGDLYREPTVADVDFGKIEQKYPDLPNWVKSRMKHGQKTSMKLPQLISEIKAHREAKAPDQGNAVKL